MINEDDPVVDNPASWGVGGVAGAHFEPPKPEDFRDEFERRMYDCYIRQRILRPINSDLAEPHTLEEVCHKNAAGDYVVTHVRHAWYGYQLAMGIKL